MAFTLDKKYDGAMNVCDRMVFYGANTVADIVEIQKNCTTNNWRTYNVGIYATISMEMLWV
jgi:hypothetical protein